MLLFQREPDSAKHVALLVKHISSQVATELGHNLCLVVLSILVLFGNHDVQVVLWLLFARTTTASTCVVLRRVCPLGRLPIVLLLDVSVESWITQIALVAATDEGASNVIILGPALAPRILCVAISTLTVIKITLIVPVVVIGLHASLIAILLVHLAFFFTIIQLIKNYYFNPLKSA